VCLSLWFVCADFRPRCLILMPTLFGLSADAVRVSTDVIHASARVFHASARAVRKPRQRGSHCFVLTPAARHTLIFVHMLPFSCHIFAKTTRRAMSARGVRFSARAVRLSSRVGHTSAHTLFGRRPACGAAVSSRRVTSAQCAVQNNGMDRTFTPPSCMAGARAPRVQLEARALERICTHAEYTTH